MNSGGIEVVYLATLGAVTNWFNGGSQTGFGIAQAVAASNNGWDNTITSEPYVIIAYPEVAQEYWSADVSNNKSIVLLNTCYSYQNGFVEACGSGGASFGYELNPDASVVNAMHNRLFKRLNGTIISSGDFVRNTNAAMNDFTSIKGFTMYPSNAMLTLCPAITEKYPAENTAVYSTVENGYIAFDTWCDASQPANQAVTLSVVSGDITINENNVNWEGDDVKSNKINFEWSGTNGEVKVTVNPEYIRAYNGGQRLDYDGETPNNDPGSYSFILGEPTVAPVSDFTYSLDNAYSPNYTVYFEDQSQYSPNTWHWSFGDGYESTSQNPNHSYFDYGIYDVTLTVSNDVGSDTKVITIIVEQQDDVISDLELSCENIPTLVTINQPVLSSCEVWGGTAPYKYDFKAIVDNSVVYTEYFDNVYAQNKQVLYTFNEINTSQKLSWRVTDANNNTKTCTNSIDVIEDVSIDPLHANFTVESSCNNNVFDINSLITFTDMSYSTNQNSCPIKRWEWNFDWESHNDDCPWWATAANECNWDIEYFTYQPTVSHSYESIEKKIVRLHIWGVDYVPLFSVGSEECGDYDQYWAGINIIDCTLLSVFLNELSKFTNAVRSDWAHQNWGGNVNIYGGSFSFNGLANDYLEQNPTTISACNEIIINGDVEFVSDGTVELVLETNECLNENLNISNKKVIDTKYNTDILPEIEISVYPNPIIEKTNLFVKVFNPEYIYIFLSNTEGKMLKEIYSGNLSIGEHEFDIDLSNFNSGSYYIEVKTNTEKLSTVQLIKSTR